MFLSGPAVSDVTSHGALFAPMLPFSDAAQTLTAGAGCVQGDPVLCDAWDSDVRLEGGDDRYSGWSFNQITVSGGDGDDDIGASGGRTIVTGGAGVDTITVGSNGTSRADGEAGDDRMRSQTGVETVLNGGDGNDLIGGQRAFNSLTGGRGNDDIFVGGGDATVTGGAGTDTIVSHGPMLGGTRTIAGDGDADTVVGSLTIDNVSGGTGNDVIGVSGDSATDSVNCGGGKDTVYADPTDVVAKNCEKVNAGPMPTSAAVEAARARYTAVFGAPPG